MANRQKLTIESASIYYFSNNFVNFYGRGNKEGIMKKSVIQFFIAVFFSVFFFSAVKADGGVFVMPEYYTFERDQKALIYYHDGIEDLVISTEYQGNSEDFTWVVPTPSKPEVNKSSSSIFSNLNSITKTKYSSQIQTTFSLGTVMDSKEDAVEIVERKNIDIYDTTILKADNEKILSQWMEQNGYTFPKEKSYLLSDYTDNDWYFVISKIRPELTQSEDIYNDLSSGNISPLRFTFASDRIIYPMRLTNFAHEYQKNLYKNNNKTSWYQPISATLFVLSDHKVDAKNFSTNYANWLKPNKIAEIIDSATESNWLNPNKKMFLTRLHNSDVSNIDDDLVIRDAENNEVYPLPYYKEPGYIKYIFIAFFCTLLAYLISPLFLGNIIFKLISIIKNNNKYFFVSHLISFIISLIIMALFLINIPSSDGLFYVVREGGYLGVFISLLIINILMLIYFIKTILKNRTNG